MSLCHDIMTENAYVMTRWITLPIGVWTYFSNNPYHLAKTLHTPYTFSNGGFSNTIQIANNARRDSMYKCYITNLTFLQTCTWCLTNLTTMDCKNGINSLTKGLNDKNVILWACQYSKFNILGEVCQTSPSTML